MASLHSSVGSKSTDPHLGGGATSPSSGGSGRGAGGGVRDDPVEGGFGSSWISRLRPLPPPQASVLPPLPLTEVEAAASLGVVRTVSTRESRTREPEVEQGPQGGDCLVAGFGPFQVRAKRSRVGARGSHGQQQEVSERRLERPQGGRAGVGEPAGMGSSYRASLPHGCFSIFQRMAGTGEVCRRGEVAERDGKAEELQAEQERGRGAVPSSRELLTSPQHVQDLKSGSTVNQPGFKVEDTWS